jgi:UDP-N-acetylglucosamine:LPS N-acetylglucosamine transferase
VEVWALGKSKDESFEKKCMDKLEQYQVRMVKFNKKYHGNRIKIIFKLRKQIRKSKPDIINTHLEYVNIYTVLASLRLGVPIVHTVHNIKIKCLWIFRFFLKYFTRKFVAISVKLKDIIREQLNLSPDKIRLIFNGINLQEYNRVKRRKEKMLIISLL